MKKLSKQVKNAIINYKNYSASLKIIQNALLTIWREGETFLNLDHQKPAEEGWEGEQLSCHSNDQCTEEDSRCDTDLER